MKRILYVPVVFFLVVIIGCQNDDVINGEIQLTNKKCPCEHNTEFIKNFSQDSILLFDNTITTWDNMVDLSSDGTCSRFISYNEVSDTTFLFSLCGSMLGTSYCCNFPDIVGDWNIPEEGLYISFSADEFELCDPKISVATNTYSNIIITFFKKLEE